MLNILNHIFLFIFLQYTVSEIIFNCFLNLLIYIKNQLHGWMFKGPDRKEQSFDCRMTSSRAFRNILPLLVLILVLCNAWFCQTVLGKKLYQNTPVCKCDSFHTGKFKWS